MSSSLPRATAEHNIFHCEKESLSDSDGDRSQCSVRVNRNPRPARQGSPSPVSLQGLRWVWLQSGSEVCGVGGTLPVDNDPAKDAHSRGRFGNDAA